MWCCYDGMPPRPLQQQQLPLTCALPVCCCDPREKLYQAALAVLPIDQLPTEERTVAAAHVDGRDLPKAGARCQEDWRGS